MKNILCLVIAFFSLCGFESLSDEIDKFEINNNTPNTWEVEQSATEIKAGRIPRLERLWPALLRPSALESA